MGSGNKKIQLKVFKCFSVEFGKVHCEDDFWAFDFKKFMWMGIFKLKLYGNFFVIVRRSRLAESLAIRIKNVLYLFKSSYIY